jgi:predicted small secreted protein
MTRTILLALIAAAALAACNTMKGMGRDVSTAGDAITGQAAETQREM